MQNFIIFEILFFFFFFCSWTNSQHHTLIQTDRTFVLNMKLFYDYYYYSNDMNTRLYWIKIFQFQWHTPVLLINSKTKAGGCWTTARSKELHRQKKKTEFRHGKNGTWNSFVYLQIDGVFSRQCAILLHPEPKAES